MGSVVKGHTNLDLRNMAIGDQKQWDIVRTEDWGV
jgi:hypothetical protein